MLTLHQSAIGKESNPVHVPSLSASLRNGNGIYWGSQFSLLIYSPREKIKIPEEHVCEWFICTCAHGNFTTIIDDIKLI